MGELPPIKKDPFVQSQKGTAYYDFLLKIPGLLRSKTRISTANIPGAFNTRVFYKNFQQVCLALIKGHKQGEVTAIPLYIEILFKYAFDQLSYKPQKISDVLPSGIDYIWLEFITESYCALLIHFGRYSEVPAIAKALIYDESAIHNDMSELDLHLEGERQDHQIPFELPNNIKNKRFDGFSRIIDLVLPSLLDNGHHEVVIDLLSRCELIQLGFESKKALVLKKGLSTELLQFIKDKATREFEQYKRIYEKFMADCRAVVQNAISDSPELMQRDAYQDLSLLDNPLIMDRQAYEQMALRLIALTDQFKQTYPALSGLDSWEYLLTPKTDNPIQSHHILYKRLEDFYWELAAYFDQ